MRGCLVCPVFFSSWGRASWAFGATVRVVEDKSTTSFAYPFVLVHIVLSTNFAAHGSSFCSWRGCLLLMFWWMLVLWYKTRWVATYFDSVSQYLASLAHLCFFWAVPLRMSCFAAALADGSFVHLAAATLAFEMSRFPAVLADRLVDECWAFASPVKAATSSARSRGFGYVLVALPPCCFCICLASFPFAFCSTFETTCQPPLPVRISPFSPRCHPESVRCCVVCPGEHVV